MSGVAGGNRIKRQDVSDTFNDYVRRVLTRIPSFVNASLSGSVKVGAKDDYGDLDLIVLFKGKDKKVVKQQIIDVVQSLPDAVIVPFKNPRYQGRKYYNAGELISVLFPITGRPGEFIQVDNNVALSVEEHTFKNNFLDLPAEIQGLLIGLTKVVTLEEKPSEIFKKLGITNLPKLASNQEFEFNLSSVNLSLRKVTLDGYKELSREVVWSSSDWEKVKLLLSKFNINLPFEELLNSIARRLTNPRSKARIAGIFKSMVSVKSGEVGTAKGAGKEKALLAVAQKLAESVEESQQVVSIYAGGFKPPHKAHFRNAQILANKSNKLIIFIGPKIREGLTITPEQSKSIWEVYTKYIDVPTEVSISSITPIRDTYEWIDLNQSTVKQIITGTTKEEMGKFSSIAKNAEKYPKVTVVELPVITYGEDEKFSAGDIRKSEDYIKSGSWIPAELSEEDKKKVINIALPKQAFREYFKK
jgi:nicotinamide mononucleotide adenylyltransferase